MEDAVEPCFSDREINLHSPCMYVTYLKLSYAAKPGVEPHLVHMQPSNTNAHHVFGPTLWMEFTPVVCS